MEISMHALHHQSAITAVQTMRFISMKTARVSTVVLKHYS